jgi:hypothetical protein
MNNGAFGTDYIHRMGAVKADPYDAAVKDPGVMKTLRETAFAADEELIAPMMRWSVNGQPAGNGWTSPARQLVVCGYLPER